MELIRRIKYNYLKKHRYLDPYVQDLIADKTNFKPFNIFFIKAWKSDNSLKELNCFIFDYEGLTYELIDGKLKVINKDTIQ